MPILPALFDLQGRNALITGSVRGIGYALAEGLADAGAGIIINGRQKAAVDEAVNRLLAAGHQATGAIFDVVDEPTVAQAFAALDDKNIDIDILINNAGVQFRNPF